MAVSEHNDMDLCTSRTPSTSRDDLSEEPPASDSSDSQSVKSMLDDLRSPLPSNFAHKRKIKHNPATC